MSTGDTRRSQSATFSNLKGKQGEEEKLRLAKRKREEFTPAILVEQPSTNTLIGENEMTETPFSGFTSSTDKQKEKVALKLNRLKDKSIIYESDKDFLNHCLAEKLVPKGLRLELGTTIGNYDQEFVDTWYAKWKSFSLTQMKDIASYCDKTIAQTKQNIRETETDLKSVTEKEEYFQIEETIKTNETKTKRLLHQCKFKKFNSLKYKEEILQRTKEPTAFKKSYANAVSGANNVKYNNHIISRSFSNANVANEPQTILGKLEAQNPRKPQQRHDKIFIFYSFYKKVKLRISIGYDFFQECAHIFHMFRDAGYSNSISKVSMNIQFLGQSSQTL